jgi:hypothetical protein
LLFRLPLALHRLVLSQGQTPIHLGSIQWGNVSPKISPFPNNSPVADFFCEVWKEEYELKSQKTTFKDKVRWVIPHQVRATSRKQ